MNIELVITEPEAASDYHLRVGLRRQIRLQKMLWSPQNLYSSSIDNELQNNHFLAYFCFEKRPSSSVFSMFCAVWTFMLNKIVIYFLLVVFFRKPWYPIHWSDCGFHCEYHNVYDTTSGRNELFLYFNSRLLKDITLVKFRVRLDESLQARICMRLLNSHTVLSSENSLDIIVPSHQLIKI